VRSAHAQAPTTANNPASIPANTTAPQPLKHAAKSAAGPASQHISEKQAHEADNAYLEGAKQVERKNMAAAEASFARAVQLNPTNKDYVLALIVARENLVTELVQHAAQARASGDTARSDALLAQARELDPDNRVVAQHFNPDAGANSAANKAPFKPGLFYGSADPAHFPAEEIASTLSGPVKLQPASGTRNIHLSGDPQTVIRNLYSLYGITVRFDSSISDGRPLTIDMDKVTFAQAARVLDIAARVFAVPLQPKEVLVAKDTRENRNSLGPQVEETLYLPGHTNDEMQEFANLARNIFDIKEVTASATGGYMLLRGDVDVLRQVNALFEDMLGNTSEVMFNVDLYEVDSTVNNNIGAALPTSINGFDLISSAQNLITSNASLINQAIASGLLNLTGSAGANQLAELAFLIAAGVSGSSQFTSLLGVAGTYGGLPLAGFSVPSSGSFNLGLNTTDLRLVDSMETRASNHQAATIRAGSRYPVITGTYSSGVSSSLASSLSGVNINGTSVSSLLSQYLGSSNVSVPQFQYEDLGITLKMTPQILHNDEISLAMSLKIEALAGGSIDSIPILNNRTLTSTITVPAGQTAMLATLINTNEVKALTGIPGLNQIPGFQGTQQDLEKDSTELLIVITPHIVRNGRSQVSSRRIAAVRMGPGSHTESPMPMQQSAPMPAAVPTSAPAAVPGGTPPAGAPAPSGFTPPANFAPPPGFTPSSGPTR
jgi:type II secretory pathway component GspD/PulD (secretin)